MRTAPADSGPGRWRARSSGWADRHLQWLLISPAVVFVLVMIVFPIGYTVVLSLTDASGSVRGERNSVGMDNYVALLSDTQRFWPAVGRTGYFTVAAVLIELVLGLCLALLLRKSFRGQSWVRVAILVPVVATPVAVGMMWLLMFEPTIGFANELLSWFGIPDQGWLSSRTQALNTLIFIDVWQWTPMVALILLAGLSTLPEEPEEAARVDGANAWQRFRHVTLPLLMPSVVAATLLRSIDALKTFDIIYATKGKGGGSFHEAETLNVLAYSYAFEYTRYGLSSALLVIFFMLICAVVAVFILLRKAGNRT